MKSPRATDVEGERLQKILAAAGFGSRRACEELILAGRVEVDRKTVTELGARADQRSQEIHVDGEILRRQKLVYYAAYKPKGVISTSADPSGRPRVTDLVPDQVRVFTVGRLDRESEGLVLLTNDGDLANRLTHPRHGVEKIYQVQVAGHAEWENLKQLRRGVYLAEGAAKVKYIKIIKRQKQSTWLEMILDEGRNREIRRVLAKLGHKVQHLKRVAIGTLRLGSMQPTEYRPLSRQEIRQLKELAAGRHKGKQPVDQRKKRRDSVQGRSGTIQGPRRTIKESQPEATGNSRKTSSSARPLKKKTKRKQTSNTKSNGRAAKSAKPSRKPQGDKAKAKVRTPAGAGNRGTRRKRNS
ncbi:MAG: pseudouridine synthase [Pirellulales bacterium]|nr:pseudouridine synthase [Pirellulales bacterium]